MRISGSRVAHEAGETRVLVLTELASHSLLKSSATTPRPERRPRAPVRRRATGVHIAMGFAFYLADVMSILTADSEPGGEKRCRYVLVRSDHVAADMDWVRAWAGLPPAMGAFPHASARHAPAEYPGERRLWPGRSRPSDRFLPAGARHREQRLTPCELHPRQ